MHEILTKSKVNLSIVINNILDSGYHEFESLVVFPNICDKILFKPTYCVGGFIVKGEFSNYVPTKNNIVCKALDILYKNYNIKQKFNVTLVKNLPVGAGVGGGSSNAAGVFRFFVDHGYVKFDSKLEKFMLDLGCDVPMCFYEKSCIVRGVGEKIIPCEFKNFKVVLINDIVSISTPTVFKKFDEQFGCDVVCDINQMIAEKYKFVNFNQNDKCDKIIKNIKLNGNNMTDMAIEINPNIQNILNDISIFNPIVFGMSGSGGTVFGLFDENFCVKKVLKHFTEKKYWVECGDI